MSPARTTSVFVLMLVYALTILAVGLWRSIDAEMFKPNAFYFCLAVSALSILGAFLVRGGWKWIGLVVAMAGAATALAFYLWCFITKPEQDASVRVACAIVASVGQLCVLATLVLPCVGEKENRKTASKICQDLDC